MTATFAQRPGQGGSTPLNFGQDHYLTSVTGDCISSVKFSPTASPIMMVGATAWDKTCTVWQLNASPQQIQSQPFMQTTAQAPLLDMCFTHDGRAFFSGCSNTAVQWNLQTNTQNVVASHDLPVSAVSYMQIPQVMDNLIITTSWDGKIRWWDLRQQNFIKEENLGHPIFALDATNSPPMMAVATGRTIHIYNTNDMMKMKANPVSENFIYNTRCASCLADANPGVLLGSSEGKVSFMKLDGAFSMTSRQHIVEQNKIHLCHQTNFVAAHPVGPTAISAGGDGKLALYSLRDNTTYKTLTEKLPQGQPTLGIAAGDLSQDKQYIAVAYSYDWAQGKAGYRAQPSRIRIVSLVG